MDDNLSEYLASPSGRIIHLPRREITEKKIFSVCRTAALCENCHTPVAVDSTWCPKCQRRFRN